MRKKYKVVCELNANASHVESVIIETNLEHKATKLAEKHFKKLGAFAVFPISCKEIKDDKV